MSLRAVVRRPRWVVGRLARRVAARCLGRWTHVAVSDGEAVLNVGLRGVRYYPLLAYLSFFPGARLAVMVATPRAPDLESNPPGRVSLLRSLLWYATGGLIHADNCVSVSSRVVRSSGLSIGPVTTPEQLLNELKEFDHRTVETSLME